MAGFVLNRNKSCTKCGKEVNETFGYRYCDCGTIFYSCCESHSYCPSCGRKIEKPKGIIY